MDEGAIIQLEVGWNEIKTVALDPLEKMLEEGLKAGKLFSNQDYSRVYTMCYNMCTQKTPFNWSEQLYARHGESITQYLANKVRPALKLLHGEQLLKEFVNRTSHHGIMNKWYSKFFTYLDRYHVRYHQLDTLSLAGQKLFKTEVFKAVKTSLTPSLLDLIQNERNNLLIDRDLVKKCSKIYEEMGLGSLDAYEQDLEVPFLEASRDFYNRQATHWIATESTPAYLVKVEKALDDERQRVAHYLHGSTEPKLLAVMDKELLEKQLSTLLEKEGSGCRVLLQQHSVADLHRMFSLLQRITNGLEPMADIFKRHILDIGQTCIDQRLNSSAPGSEAKENAESRENEDAQFIKDLISIHEKYQEMVRTQFNQHNLFQKALKDAFTDLVNKEDIGGGSGSGGSKYKAADLMASFCDRLLRKNSAEKLSDNEIERFLEQTVSLFFYLSDKDFFAEVYRNQLAKRLLNQRSASDEMEKVMIGKLKSRCGAQFTGKMEGMMNDLAIAAEQTKDFERFCKDNPVLLGSKVNFSVQILTTGHWPQYKQFNEIALPTSMLKCMEAFRTFYDNKTNNNKRKLTWVYSLGNVSFKSTFNKKSYDIAVTTVQAAVMLLFNANPTANPATCSRDELLQTHGVVSFTYLQEVLNMPEDVLKKVLHSLCFGKFKIVKRITVNDVHKILGTTPDVVPADGAEGKEEGKEKEKAQIRKTDIYQFNDSFSSPMRQIRLPMALLDDSGSGKKVEEDRTFAVEAAIVRTMKARKQLSHQQLLVEVMAQLAFFKPDPKLIKQRIENLIDREYLERDPDNPSTYRYLA